MAKLEAGDSEIQQRASTTPDTSELAGPRAGVDDQRQHRYDRLLANAPKPRKGASQNIPRATDLKLSRRCPIKWHRAKGPKASTGTGLSAIRAKPPAARRSVTAKRLVPVPQQKDQSIKAFFQRHVGANTTRYDATSKATAHCDLQSAHTCGKSVGAIGSGAGQASRPT